MAIPPEAVDAPANRAIVIFALVLAGVVALATVLARVIGRRIAEPVAALASATDKLAKGEDVEVFESSRISELRSLEKAFGHAARTQARWKRAEEQMRSVVEHVHDGIITIDEHGTIESFNHAAEKLFGFGAPEVIGRNVSVLMPSPYRAEHDDYIANYLRTGRPGIIGTGREVTGQRKDGSTFPMDLAVSEFRLGERRFFTGIVRDITERKHAEQALKDADRHKDEFLAMLSHELRNPLAPIRTGAEIVRLESGGSARLNWAAGLIDRQVRHLHRLVDDLLELSRVAQGRLSLALESVDLRDIIWLAVEMDRAAGDAKRHALVVEVAERSFFVRGDVERLVQVVSNLLTNAIKYSPAGSTIHVAAFREGDRVCLRVRDTGSGINPELLPHIFDLFVQGERTLERAEGGLGIGLALVKAIVELHEGEVAAKSEGPGKGAEFEVRLPLLPASPFHRSEGKPEPTHDQPRRRLRILLADDNPDALESLGYLLEHLGHEVELAADGNEALALARAFLPQVAILDLGLPGLDGYALAEELRRDTALAAVVLVALTGYGQEADRQKTRAAGFDFHLLKPVGMHDLAPIFEGARPKQGMASG